MSSLQVGGTFFLPDCSSYGRLRPTKVLLEMMIFLLLCGFLILIVIHISQKISPPSPYVVVKGALDRTGPVLRRTFEDEEISISVMRMLDIIPGGSADDYGNDNVNQLFVHVDISKPGQQESLHFLCGLYPDALGIHSVSLRPKSESSGFLVVPAKYNGPVFE